MATTDLRAYAAEGAIPFRSTDAVDWVDLATVIAWDKNRRATRAEGIRELLDEDPWDGSRTGERSPVDAAERAPLRP